MIIPRPGRALALALCVASGAPGCGGCGESAPVAVKAEEAAEARPTPAPPTAPAAPIAHPLAPGWQRTPPPEPAPEARGLYRRAIDRAHAGDPAEAAAIAERIRRDFEGSRFARRMRDGGDPRATAALLGLAALVAASVWAGALRSAAGP